jgi:hypothetical protein
MQTYVLISTSKRPYLADAGELGSGVKNKPFLQTSPWKDPILFQLKNSSSSLYRRLAYKSVTNRAIRLTEQDHQITKSKT